MKLSDYQSLGVTEAGTQATIIARLEAMEWAGECVFMRTNSFSGRITRHNGSEGFIKNNKPGWPDISLLLPSGVFVGVEVKGPKTRQSDDQKRMEERFKSLDFEYWLVRSYEEFAERLSRVMGRV